MLTFVRALADCGLASEISTLILVKDIKNMHKANLSDITDELSRAIIET